MPGFSYRVKFYTKKFIVTILFLVLTPFYSWAISLEEIQSNPERYVKMNENQLYIDYMDVESIQSLRYEPPYYTLQGDTYLVVRGKNIFYKTTMIFYYDYQRSAEHLAQSIEEKYRNISRSQLHQEIYQELMRDSGVEVSTTNGKGYDIAGNFIQDFSSSGYIKNKVLLMTGWSRNADYMFYKYYNRHFFYTIL